MKKQTRTILFTAFVAFFLLITPILVLYAQGYRFDFEKFRVVKTGAIFVQARPFPVEITIDGEEKKQTSFLFRNVFTSNLLPRSYTIDIEKEGYFSWHKELPVEAGLVTETSHITLFPNAPISVPIHSSVSSIFHAPDQKASVVTFTNDFGSKQVGLYVRKEETITEVASLLFGENIRSVIWSRDNTRPLIVLERRGASPRLLIGSTIEPRTFSFVTIPSSRILSAMRANTVRWQWSNDSSLLYLAIREGFYKGEATRALYSIDLVQKKIVGPLLSHIQDFRVFKDGIVVLEAQGTLVQYSHVFKNKKELVKNVLPPPAHNAGLLGTRNALLLYNEQSLYILNEDQGIFLFVDGGVEYPLLAPDRKKVIFVKDGVLTLYWIEDTISGYARIAGDSEPLTTYNGKLAGLSWLFSPFQYLAIATDQGLMVAEIDARDNVNIVEYPDFSSTSPISWNQKEESLLVLTDSTLRELALTKPE